MGGSNYNVEWVTSNPGYGYVRLLYSLDNGTSWVTIDNVPNPLVMGGNPTYTWTVPNITSAHCRVKVLWHSGGSPSVLYDSDLSDAEFTITPVQIYFSSGGDIKVVLAGGIGETNLTKSSDFWEYRPSASADGNKVAFAKMELDAWGKIVENTSEIWVMGSNGENQVRITNNNVDDVEPAISPDGQKIVFSRFDTTGLFSNIYLFEGWMWSPTLRRYIPLETQLTSGNHQDREPCFSPDGTKIVFSSNREGGKFQLYTLDISNPANVMRALPGVPPYTEKDQRTPDWSPDGKWFVCSMGSATQSDIYIADSWGSINTRRVFQLTSTPEREVSPSWSPDSREIVFMKMRSGPDITIQELWTMKLGIDNLVRVVENKLLKDIGSTPMGEEKWIGYPSWRRLEGLRIPDVELEGEVDNPFSAKLEVLGGASPYTWVLLGTLPPGLSFSQGVRYPIDLSSLAFITGTPTEAVREHRFEVRVVDNLGLLGQRSFIITVKPKHALELVTAGRFLPPAVQGVRYRAQVQFKGGLPPYQVTVESGIYGKDLPAGLTWGRSVSGDQLTIQFNSPDNGLPSGRYAVKILVADNFGDVALGFFNLHVLRMEWNVRDVFGENLNAFVWGLPEEVGMERFLAGLSIEAGGIEVSIPISGVSISADREYHTIIAPYPQDFSPWRSLFTPGVSTVPGKLKLKVNLDSNEATVTADFPIHGYMFRRDRGFQFPNFSSGPISFDQFAEFFGWDETTYWVFGERVPRFVPWLLWNVIPIGGGGNCTGMSVSAYDIAENIARSGWTSYPNLPHALERNSWLSEPGEALEAYIKKRQWWIVSMEFIRLFSTVIPARSNWGRWSNEMLEDIQAYGLPCYVVMFKGLSGAHTVTAYAIEDLPDGRKLIRVYDSNKPFRYTESWDDNSAIFVDPRRNNSWTYHMGYDRNGNPIIWGGDWILAIPIGHLRGDPDLPGLLDLPELITDWTFFALIGSAGPAQVTDNQGNRSFTTEGGLNIDPATGMPYCLPMPFPAGDNLFGRIYYVPVDKSYQLNISGEGSGKYDFLYMPMDEMLIDLNADTSVGSEDNITFKPQELSVAFSTRDSKKFGYKMARELKGERVARMFTLDNIETHSGDITFSTTPEGDAVIVRNDGAATSYDLRVDYLHENETWQIFERRGISLGSGETQRITPSSWEVLSAGEVNVEIDRGSDGSWDENIKLKSGKPGEKPPEEKPSRAIRPEVIVGIALAGAIAAGSAIFLKKRRKTGTI